MSEVSKPNGKITINFNPVIVRPIAGVHSESVKARVGGFNTWVEVPSDFTLDRVGEIFDVQLPWLSNLKPEKESDSNQTSTSEVQIPSSKGGGTYTVRRMGNGKVICSCSGYSWRGSCKHLAMLDNPETIPKPKDSIKIF
jgi:hypothetical protein